MCSLRNWNFLWIRTGQKTERVFLIFGCRVYCGSHLQAKWNILLVTGQLSLHLWRTEGIFATVRLLSKYCEKNSKISRAAVNHLDKSDSHHRIGFGVRSELRTLWKYVSIYTYYHRVSRPVCAYNVFYLLAMAFLRNVSIL